MRGSHFLLLIFMCAIALPLGWRVFTDYRTQSEERRIMVAEKILVRKLEVYQIANGHPTAQLPAQRFRLYIEIRQPLWFSFPRARRQPVR
jgi:hypothetical protein